MLELGIGAAFLAGLLGSGHCLAMCGPIAALAGVSAPGSRLRSTLLYNLGRVSSYAAAGAAGAALLGRGIDYGVDAAGWSALARLAQIAFALMVIALGLNLAFGWRGFGAVNRWGGAFWQRLRPLAGRLFPIRRPWQALVLGALWGWLPCGLVYAVLAAAWLSADATQGAAMMAAFGLGTLPAMAGVGLSAAKLRGRRVAPWLRTAGGIALVAGAVWPLLMSGAHHPGTQETGGTYHAGTTHEAGRDTGQNPGSRPTAASHRHDVSPAAAAADTDRVQR